jgi:hypothetical protein
MEVDYRNSNLPHEPIEVAAVPGWTRIVSPLCGLIGGAAAGMNQIAASEEPKLVTNHQIGFTVGVGAALGLLTGMLLCWATGQLVCAAKLEPGTRSRYLRGDVWINLLLLIPLAGAGGVVFAGPLIALLAGIFLAVKVGRLYGLLSKPRRVEVFSSLGWLAFLFLISGFAALIYQIVWERVLFAAFGVNIESITIVVALFMFGLGLGSMAGGLFVSRFPERAPIMFLICETLIGCFGVVSISLIEYVSKATLHGTLPMVSLTIFGLLVLPTMLMGATLPILVSHLHRYYRNLGKSVGLLYSINTVGSAIACFATADVLFVIMGEQASVWVAAICNFAVGILVMRYAKRIAAQAHASEEPVVASEGV